MLKIVFLETEIQIQTDGPIDYILTKYSIDTIMKPVPELKNSGEMFDWIREAYRWYKIHKIFYFIADAYWPHAPSVILHWFMSFDHVESIIVDGMPISFVRADLAFQDEVRNWL